MEGFSSMRLSLGVQSLVLNLFSFKNLAPLMLLCLCVCPVEFRCPTGSWYLFLACGNMESGARALLGVMNIQFCPVLAQTWGGIAAFLLHVGRAVQPPGPQDNASSGRQSGWLRK